MKTRFGFICSFLLLLTVARGQSITYMKASDLDYWKTQKSDTVFIINFWASWCHPCLEELPELERITKAYAGKNVKVILVSNDFKKQVNSNLRPFLARKKVQSMVMFMDEANPNDWIEKVNPGWGGSIPATWIIQSSSNYEKFKEGKVTFEELKKIIDPLIQ